MRENLLKLKSPPSLTRERPILSIIPPSLECSRRSTHFFLRATFVLSAFLLLLFSHHLFFFSLFLSLLHFSSLPPFQLRIQVSYLRDRSRSKGSCRSDQDFSQGLIYSSVLHLSTRFSMISSSRRNRPHLVIAGNLSLPRSLTCSFVQAARGEPDISRLEEK